MFYSQVILAKKGPLAKVWLAAHWGDKKLARPQIFATDISQSCTDIMNPSVPLALRLSGHLLLGVVRIYSRKVKYVLNDCTEAMLKLQMAFAKQGASSSSSSSDKLLHLQLDANGNPLHSRELLDVAAPAHHQLVANFGEYDRVHVVEGFCLPLPEDNEWILAEDDAMGMGVGMGMGMGMGVGMSGSSVEGSASQELLLAAHLPGQRQQRHQRRQRHQSSSGGGSSPGTGNSQEEEETWAPFDPDDEEEDDDDDDEQEKGLAADTSHVSEIEVVRAANNESLLSEDQTRRSSSLLDKSALTADGSAVNSSSGNNNNNNNNNPEEEDYDFAIPFGEDESEDENKPNAQGIVGAGLDDSALQLSRDGEGGTPLSNNNSNNLMLAMDEDSTAGGEPPPTTPGSKGLSLLLDQDASTTNPQQQQQQQPPPRKRRRKRRKVIIDNHETELTNDHIREMLRDTDDTVRPMIHPASLWDEDDTGKDYRTLVLEKMATNSNSKKRKKSVTFRDPRGTGAAALQEKVPCLTRPFLADAADCDHGHGHGHGGPQLKLHPVLHQLWQDNYWKAIGKACPYRRLQSEDADRDGNEVDDVEQVRRGMATDDEYDDESTVGGRSIPEVVGNHEGPDRDDAQSRGRPEDEDTDFLAANDEDDDEEEDTQAPIPNFGDDEEMNMDFNMDRNLSIPAPAEGEEDPLDLGLVNDIDFVLDSDQDEHQDDDDDEDRQAIGDVASSSTKWHKHTSRVFQHLKKCMKDPNAVAANTNNNDDDDDNASSSSSSSKEQQLPDRVRFRELTKNVVSRRNASSVFFEMLQLKTWDFIELDQERAYGDIVISPGLRFGEDAPVN